MATLTFLGHSSCRVATKKGTVVYIDPFFPGDYSQPADLILVTHEHYDHNVLELVTPKPDCRVIRAAEAIAGQYAPLTVKDVKILPVPAGNANHDPKACVGYILTVDGKTLYHAGDTSAMPHMDDLAAKHLDWALLPVDGVYNMGPAEASLCARRIAAAHTIPIHTNPQEGNSYDRAQADQLTCPGKALLAHGESIEL